MNAIAAVDANWAIGNKNRLLTSIPADMKFFREKTMGHVVVMGRKTLESFPNGLPLKNRVNIVLTANRSYKVKDAIIVHTKEELLEELKKYDSNELYVIGGGSIYEMLIPYFPNLDQMDDWEMTEVSEEQTCFDLEYVFAKYERK